MPWRGHAATICKRCGRHVSECGPLSARYLCLECGESAALENRRGLMAHRGPALLRWRRGVVAAAGGILMEDLEAEDGAIDSDTA